MAQYMADTKDGLDEFDSFGLKLEHWQAFFGEEKASIDYDVLTKISDIAKRHNKKHKKALAYLKDNQMQTILDELLALYPELQSRYDYHAEQKAELMPDMTDITGFAQLLSPVYIYIFSEYRDDLPYMGIVFHRLWDVEHGLGVLLCKDGVVMISSADVANDIKARRARQC